MKKGYVFWKRGLDVFFSVILILFLAIPMLIIALAVIASSRGGAIFRQERVGKNEKIFICYKFRTMYNYAPREVPSAMLCDADRDKYITPVGSFLRRTSLDELPQLFNVLKGDMSLVGPRPIIIGESEIHKFRAQRGVYLIRPGITGLAQISGRNALTDDKKAELDGKYAENMGFIPDIKIIMRTLSKVISGDGISDGKKETR